jgi:hypothetical protein
MVDVLSLGELSLMGCVEKVSRGGGLSGVVLDEEGFEGGGSM